MATKAYFRSTVLRCLVWLLPMAAGAQALQEGTEDALAGFERRVLTLPDGERMNTYTRPGDGAWLVLVPGTWGSARRFAPLIAELPGDMPIALVDLCWQGGNVPAALDMTIESLANDVLRVIEELHVDRFVISGHSIGGMIAVEIAGRDVPGLVGAIPMEGWTHHTVVRDAFNGIVTGELTPEQKAESEAERAQERAHLSEEQLKAIGKIWTQWNGYDALALSKVPILHIWGDRGKPPPNRKALQIPEKESITIAWIAGASHPLLLEAPEQVAELVARFMRRY